MPPRILTPQVLTIQDWVAAGGGLSVNAMRPVAGIHQNGMLRQDEWEQIDAAVVDVVRRELVAVTDLTASGLVKPLGGLGVIYSTYEQVSDMDAASVSMTGLEDGEDDGVTFTPVQTPVPLHYKDFKLSIRHLEASRRIGETIDVTQTRIATRKVAESLESMVFSGIPKGLGTVKMYGYLNHPKRLTKTAAAWGGGDFGTEGNGYLTILGMRQGLAALGYSGPYGVYVSDAQYTELLKRMTDGSGKSELQTILEGIPDIAWVKPRPIAYLADETVAMVNLSPDTVQLGVGQDVTNVLWEQKGGFLQLYRVMAAMNITLKYDAGNKLGVAIATAA